MILTLISIGIFVIGIILWHIKNSRKFKLSYDARETLENIGFGFILIGIIFMVAFGMVIGINAIFYELDYQNFLHENEMLEYRIEHMEENITGNEMLYNDIVEFNNKLRKEKKWANNQWTNWFNNKDIASLDYIELD